MKSALLPAALCAAGFLGLSRPAGSAEKTQDLVTMATARGILAVACSRLGSRVPGRDVHVSAEEESAGETVVTAYVCDRLTDEARPIVFADRSVNLAGRRSAYEASGWTGFKAPSRSFDDIEAERDRVRRLTLL